MSKEQRVSAIGTIELARRLKSFALLDDGGIRAIAPELLTCVNKLEAGEDISDTYDAFFPEAWIIALWRSVETQHSDSPAGFLAGRTIATEAYGMLQGLVRFSETLGQSLTTYLQNIHYVNPSEQWQMSVLDGEVALCFSYPSHKPYTDSAIERSMTAMHEMGCYLSGRKIPVHRVQFKRGAPPYLALLEDYFGCGVEFSAPRNALAFPAHVLDWPLQDRTILLKPSLEQGKSYLTGLFKKSLQTDMRRKTEALRDPSVTDKVVSLLRADPRHYSDLTQVASTLHMSRATLYRKLQQEGSSFSLIRDAVREELMAQFEGKKAIDIYEQLGFHDISSFYKARKRKNTGA